MRTAEDDAVHRIFLLPKMTCYSRWVEQGCGEDAPAFKVWLHSTAADVRLKTRQLGAPFDQPSCSFHQRDLRQQLCITFSPASSSIHATP